MEIISDIEELAMKMQLFILCWACGLEKSVKDEKDRELIVEAQEMYLVRGNRYQIFQNDSTVHCSIRTMKNSKNFWSNCG